MLNKEEFNNLIINELKEFGVKFKEKRPKSHQDLPVHQKKIFQTHLQFLELTDVILFNGSAVQIPKFVADACSRVLEQVETEGIFRKAGSSLRQKEIRKNLEAGLPICRAHHVIDVANVIKYFFRELPEPLIPPTMQETLLRSMWIGENSLKAILLICLLMPPLTLNTLSFFMQFLKTVSGNSDLNKMTTGNLAIIFAPGIMPFPDINTQRLNNHVKAVQMLIENANLIGSIPDCLCGKLQSIEMLSTNSPAKTLKGLESTQKKKKKRRSGSLTQMFSGIRKIVGAAIGSLENLDKSPEKKMASTGITPTQYELDSTPCIKTTKKRKFADPVCAFSAKKKKDLLALLPSNSGGLLPSTPLTKESKKSQMSLGSARQVKNISANPIVTSMERRFSIVGTGWSRLKHKNLPDPKNFQNNKSTFQANEEDIDTTKVLANINIPTPDYPILNNFNENSLKIRGVEKCYENCEKEKQNEYDAIKERVEAIEDRITKEFSKLRDSLTSQSVSINVYDNSLSGPECVQTKYERVVLETENLCSPTTEQLAKRLSRDLKIRRSIESKIIRSPSARKIGTLRRRSQEKARLSRNKSWHISSNVFNGQNFRTAFVINSDAEKKLSLNHREENFLTNNLESAYMETKFDTRPSLNSEQWTSAEVFFNHLPNQDKETIAKAEKQHKDLSRKQKEQITCTPVKTTCVENNTTPAIQTFHTPMLPPRTIPRKGVYRTPNSVLKPSLSGNKVANKLFMSTPIEEDGNGRASIARLREQNAGMVMAKAKLFDCMGNNSFGGTLQSVNTSLTANNIKESQTLVNNIPTASISNKVIFNNNDNFKQKVSKNEFNTINTKKNISRSPTYKKRHRIPASTKKNVLNSIITNEKNNQRTYNNNIITESHLRQIRNLKESSKMTTSPRKTKVRHNLNANSPRTIRHLNTSKHTHSPMAKYRKSPCSKKSRNGRYVPLNN